jgi:release factor glutamine methyltransferase
MIALMLMTIKESIWEFSRQLTPLYAAREAMHITHMVFGKVTGLSRLDLITRSDTSLSADRQKELDEKLHMLLDLIPVQYVIGEAWFYKLRFKVNSQVLIPRPETEELVEWMIEDLRQDHLPTVKNPARPLAVLDIGTGSGCIAIALKKAVPGLHVIALDNSGPALEVAQANAALHHVSIRFMQADILDPAVYSSLPPLDLIVSNPPYIPLGEKKELQPQVAKREPSTALFVPDNNPLLFYQAILKAGMQKLAGNGKVYVEIHENFGKEVTGIFRDHGFERVILRQDLNGRDRMVSGIKPVQ